MASGASFASSKAVLAMAGPGLLGAVLLVAVGGFGPESAAFGLRAASAFALTVVSLGVSYFWARRFEARHRGVLGAWERQARDARGAFDAMATEAEAVRARVEALEASSGAMQGALDSVIEHGRAIAGREARALTLVEEGKDRDAVRVWRRRQDATDRADFLDALAHELRTPLKAMTDVTELTAKTQKSLNARGRDNLDRVIRGGHELLRLVENLSEWIRSTRPSSGVVRETEIFDLPKLVDECVAASRPLLTGKESDFVVRVEEGLATIRQDRERVRRIILDLLANAARFTERGDIEARFDRVSANGSAHGGSRLPSGGILKIEIRDPGVGFEAVDTAFEPFGRIEASTAGRFGSTGLALHLVRESAAALEGRVDGRSQPGEGSVFSVELPLLSVTSVVARPAGARLR